MSRDEIFNEVQEIFRDVFDDDELVIKDSTNADDIEDWDSLNQINLLSAIEQEFNIKLGLGELKKLKNVGSMIDLMMTKIN